MHKPRRSSRTRHPNGFSFIEVVVSALIVGMLMVPAVTLLASVARSYFHSAERDRAYAIAESLMSEIVQSHFLDPDSVPQFGPEPGEQTSNRADFDDVDDYEGLSENPPTNKDGTPVAGADGYTQSVTIEPVILSGGFLQTQVDPTDMNLISVNIIGPSGIEVQISALRHQKSPLDEAPFVPTTAIRKVQLRMGLRKPGTQLSTGSDLLIPIRNN